MTSKSERGARLAAVAALAAAQDGLVTRAQLRGEGVGDAVVRRRVGSGRWSLAGPTVVSMTTGTLTERQRRRLAVLHPPGAAALSGRTALAVHGLRGWEGDEVTAIVRAGLHLEPLEHPGVRLHRTRRPFEGWCTEVDGLPVLRVAPAALLLAARLPSERAAGGLLAAVVQQRLTDSDELLDWLERLRPLARSAHLRRTLGDIAGGAESMAEIDLGRMCREHDLADPVRQQQRRDREGRRRWTDATWVTASGITVALEVDGAFHRDAQQWVDDIARQRALTSPTYLVVRCTAQELRDHPERIAADLRALGVPRRTAAAA
ncbi:very-short-patch-repair endonuclease [Nocardioides zeae]|uniref:Very-short-patch-repair endonuclease n=2 Tax=Nocardioides zeae TaxID=1457234 RepID=A0ACC6IEV7_9ACTN|nr:hypothetical protein [Nocardioides zeae]MDQ1105962.1 very-short-patch-repair endonuclease [Nocardioides zeae]MDR6174394.1 very-short-patch-repair endonuclease [Nocardioides zeae]MDR6209199.1 very-short-patch-repair endonuclease [Nocardioides zeae]